MHEVLDVLAVVAYGFFIAAVVLGAMFGLHCLSQYWKG